MEWDTEKCVNLINLYKAKPEIWQTTHKFYHNKIKKQNAWNEIAKDMETTTDIIKSKINSLLSSFRRERAKEENSLGTGKGRDETYRSKWFAYEAFQFLVGKNKCRKTPNTQKNKNNEKKVTETDVNEKIADIHTNKQIKIQDEDTSSGILESTSQKTTDNTDVQETATQQHNVAPPKIKKRKTDVTSDARIDIAKRDDCEVYGEYVGMKLRSYNKRTQAVVQHLISNILFNADMGQYDTRTNTNHTNVASNNVQLISGASTPYTQAPSPSTYSQTPSPYSSDSGSPIPTYSNNANPNTTS